MTFDYMCHLTKEEVENPSSSEQWAGQYNRFIAVGKEKGKEKANLLREKWKTQYVQDKQAPEETIAPLEWQAKLGLSPTPETVPALDTLPSGSFLIHFTFKLQTPYLSKDDNDFHIIDNPLLREKVFYWPMVRPSGWKGSLCHALWQLGHQEDQEGKKQLYRIFGKIRGGGTSQAGRLYLYPTFFTQSDLEIINPHGREKRVGKNPILLECVPARATGPFTLLYVPFDRIGEGAEETRVQVAADLHLVAEGIQAMMTIYGFGAKTSSGFGLAEDLLASEGKLVLRAGLPDTSSTTAGLPEPENEAGQLQADIKQFMERFDLSSFPRWTNEELARSGWGKKRQSEYKRLRNRHPDWNDTTHSWQAQPGIDKPAAAEEETTPAPIVPITPFTFTTLSELQILTQHIADQLRDGGEA